MDHITQLLQYLRNNKWHMTSFIFRYNEIDYIVLFEDLNNLDLTNDGYDVYLTFVDANDEDRTLSLKANSLHFKFNVREFRQFFYIKYSTNLGNIFQQFYNYFNTFVPTTINAIPTPQEQQLIINRLNHNDNNNNMCCYALKRNPVVNGTQYYRTIFNAEKCRRLKEDLYQHYKDEDTISFCFRENDELPTSEIMRNFAIQEAKRFS